MRRREAHGSTIQGLEGLAEWPLPEHFRFLPARVTRWYTLYISTCSQLSITFRDTSRHYHPTHFSPLLSPSITQARAAHQAAWTTQAGHEMATVQHHGETRASQIETTGRGRRTSKEPRLHVSRNTRRDLWRHPSVGHARVKQEKGRRVSLVQGPQAIGTVPPEAVRDNNWPESLVVSESCFLSLFLLADNPNT